MAFALSNDPDMWTEDDWIHRLDLHATRYGLTDRATHEAVGAINRGVVTLDGEGGLIVIDTRLVETAMLEIDFERS
jgi:hypothetical protein